MKKKAKHVNDRISEEEYYNAFTDEAGDKTKSESSFTSKKEKALEHALDIRKFEIALYWKRAAYFWTFIAAALAGYAIVQTSSALAPDKADLSVLLSCLGIVFSFGWFCVNKGSKQWQENWENHVDMLEDDVVGPLYKVILSRPKPRGADEKIRHAITGPSKYSVSKINQIISLFITVLWVILLSKSLWPLSLSAPINGWYIGFIILTVATCISFVTLGRTHSEDFEHIATKRKATILPPDI